MSDLIPAGNHGGHGSPLAVLTDPAGGSAFSRVRSFTDQPAIRRALPWFGGMAAIGALALTYSVLSPAPQRALYTQLDDGQRASVTTALDKAAIPYKIDGNTGSLSVNEEDLYRARMVVASDGALSTPESGIELLDTLPLGASRTMEGERLRAARERELMLTIKEIDGVESVRVHLAEPEQSVFVRDSSPPSASVMLRLANGRLLSQKAGKDTDGLELQARMEEKLRAQVNQLLTPVMGAENFSSEIQVELDMDERTAARESYDKDGVIRSETEETSNSASSAAVGVPGVLSNTPPPPSTAQPGAPEGTPAPAAATPTGTPSTQGESRASRTYELGREVAVTNSGPGRIKRLSVAVVLSAEAMKKAKAADIEKIKALVGAAVGANPARGDQVEVMVRSFKVADTVEPAFYETAWFATVLRNAVALIGVLLVLLLGVRPLLRMMKNNAAKSDPMDLLPLPPKRDDGESGPAPDALDRSLLNRQVGAAQKIVDERPDRAVIALRQMLSQQPGTQS